MKTELSFIPNVHQMENAMAKERADFIEKQSDKIALRAIDRNGLMVGREFDDYKSAVDMARDYWIKGFLYVEAFSLDGEKFVLHYHGVRTY
ncbi:MAG: hypothetical protein J6K96_04205 [Treponema sp.]|nr:hypothetical protein [Treponema sp.]